MSPTRAPAFETVFHIVPDNFRTVGRCGLIRRDGDLSERRSKAKSARAAVSLTG
jgi:hypothetical protein